MISKNTIFITMAIMALIAMSFMIVFGDRGLADLNMEKRRKADLIRKNQELARENLSYKREIYRLKHDPEYIESVARKDLKVVRKNEIIFKIEDNRANRPSVPTVSEPEPGNMRIRPLERNNQ